jgi:hypothetical protein
MTKLKTGSNPIIKINERFSLQRYEYGWKLIISKKIDPNKRIPKGKIKNEFSHQFKYINKLEDVFKYMIEDQVAATTIQELIEHIDKTKNEIIEFLDKTENI